MFQLIVSPKIASAHKVKAMIAKKPSAIVRHSWQSESGTGDGKWNVSRIGVLQVWQKQGSDWKLLARQAFTRPAA